MSDALTIGWTVAQTERALRTYKRVLGFNMVLHLIVGLSCLLAPVWVLELVGLPSPTPDGWVRVWGAMQILVTALFVPGLLDPLRAMAPNAIGIAGRYWMTAVWIFCGGGFLWFALFDGVFATIIGLLYRRLLRIQLMSHPLGVHSWPKPPSIRSTSRSEWPSPNRQSLMLSKLFRASSLPYHQAK